MYRDNTAEEINRLTAELAEAQEDLEHARRRAREYSRWMVGWAIAAMISTLLFICLPIFLAVRAPLSADTRGAAREFCDALDKQDHSERKARESP